ncbi:recombinase family protein [Streptomyces sp. SID13666]|uniref:recombinase family protein n=1 Tax=Streptomyces sp. SID13666 TaxID=2706054 RepID=UPI0013BF30AE|nr:recombinase family protein [Streptomyces sp. SID13666]NEA56403.1 recombinase family protein [Streptomyces sp. SID13666]
MKPLIYGYMRVTDEMDDLEVRLLETQMSAFAEREGFCLTTVFYEYDEGSQAAFTELVHEVRRAEARHIVVPSYEQMAESQIVQALMVETVALQVGAAVHETTDSC